MSKLIHEKKFLQGKFQVFDARPDFSLLESTQTHSTIILNNPHPSEEADGILIDPNSISNLPIAIKTADCLPILLLGDKIVLIHAGWKGLALGILKSKILKDLSIKAAYIGPSIQKYQVQEDFKGHFPGSKFFYTNKDALYFNLQEEAQSQLTSLFPGIKVYNSNICTLLNTDYNSYRRDQTSQRNWNIFILNK